MNQYIFIWLSIAVGLWTSPLTAADLSKPNIVLILADDLGYGDVGCYKKKPSKIPTPNMDRIAAEGMRFTDAHSPSSVCSPTRYALLTGRYAWRSRLQRGVLGPWGAPLITPERMTVGSLLQRQGYTTACIGKWHLGWHWPTKDGQPPATGPDRLSNVDFSQPIAQGPTTRGFDYYFGVDVPNYPPYCFIENDRTAGLPTVVNKPEFNPETTVNRMGRTHAMLVFCLFVLPMVIKAAGGELPTDRTFDGRNAIMTWQRINHSWSPRS